MAYKSISAVVASANNVANPTTLTPVLPTRATGDLLIAITSCRSITATVATPSGWTIWPGFPKRSGTASGGSIYVFYKEVAGGEANPALVWTGVATTTSGDSSQACIVCLDGAENTGPSDVTPPAATDASAAGPSIPTLTTATASAVVVGIGMKVIDTATTGTIASSFTERGDFHTTTGTGHHLYVATRDMASAGATGASAVTESPTTAARCLSVAIAVKKHVAVTLFGATSLPITFGKAVAGGPPPDIGHISSADAYSSASTPTLAITVPAGGYPAGALVLVGASGVAGALPATPTCADTRGNTWARFNSYAHATGTPWTTSFWTIVTTPMQAGDTVTITWGSSLNQTGAIVSGFSSASGWAAGGPIAMETDEETNWTGLTTVDPFPAALPEGIGIQYIVSEISSGTGAITPGAGWTEVRERADDIFPPSGIRQEMAYQVRSSFAAAYSAGASWGVNSTAVVAAAHFRKAGAPVVVQKKTGKVDAGANGVDLPLTFDAPTTPGNAIIVSVSAWNTANNALTFTCADNKGNTYSTPPGGAGRTPGFAWMQQFYCINIAGGSTHTVTLDSNLGNYIQAELMEVSGLGTASPLDTSVENEIQGHASSSTTGNITATTEDFVVAAMTEDGGFTAAVTADWVESYDGNTGQPLHTAYRSMDTETAACVFSMSGSGGTAAMALALKVGAVVSGPVTYYGATSLAATVGATTAGQRKTFSAVAMPLAFSATTAGIGFVPGVTYYGATSLAATVSAFVSGRRRTTSAVALPASFAATTVGQRRTTSTVALPASFAATTAGRRRTTSATALPATFAATTQARRKTFSQVALPITNTRVVAGVRKTFGQVAAPFAFSAATAAWRKTFGQVALPVTSTRVVSGQRKTFSALVMPETFGATTAGLSSIGAVTHYGSTSLAASFGAVTAARRKTFGVVALAMTATRAVAASRKTFGQIALTVSNTRVVAGQRKTFGVVAHPIVFSAAVYGQATTGAITRFGQVALPIAISTTTVGRRKTFSVVALPISARIAVSTRKTFGRTDLPLVFGAVTKARILTEATILNNADAIYLGSPVDSVRTDDDLVWSA